MTLKAQRRQDVDGRAEAAEDVREFVKMSDLSL